MSLPFFMTTLSCAFGLQTTFHELDICETCQRIETHGDQMFMRK